MIAPAHALTLLADKLEPGEPVLYAARPDIRVTLRNKLALWWIGVPWCIAVFGLYFANRASLGVTIPMAMAGLAILIAPILIAIDTRSTLYAITDRRALILHDGIRPGLLSCPFSGMDEKLELLTAGGKDGLMGGHLYFASGFPQRLRDVDYTGKLAFRDLADVPAAAQALERARSASSRSAS